MTNENVEPTAEGLTDEDLAAVAASLNFDEAPALTHTLLELWREILSSSQVARKEKVTPSMAHRIITVWPQLTYKDIPDYWTMYYAMMDELEAHLHDVIASKPDALENIENDGVENRDLYLELIFRWSDNVTRWEEEWTPESENAALRVAVISDVAAFFIGNQGLVEGLSQPQVGFTYDDDDRTAMLNRLREAVQERAN